MKIFTIHIGHTAVYGHSGTLGRGPAARPDAWVGVMLIS
jgi:hypothetical protein